MTVYEDFVRRIEGDPELPVGKLPWLMSENEWLLFRECPQAFRKKRHVAIDEEAYWADMKAWAHDEGKYAANKPTPARETVVIMLTQEEYDEAIKIGFRRDENAKDEKRPVVNNAPDEIEFSLLGAIGEKAYSKWRNVPWKRAFKTGKLRENGKKPADF